MGFSVGSSSLLQSHFPSSFSSTSSCSLSMFLQAKNNANAEAKRKQTTPSSVVAACTRQDDQSDDLFSKKRAVLLVGISVLPFLHLRAGALEGPVTKRRRRRGDELRKGIEKKPDVEETDMKTVEISNNEETSVKVMEEESQIPELAIERRTPPNRFLSLLNGLGIIGVGVFGALYALARKEKKASDTAMESLASKLKEKEAAIAYLEKTFEAKLLSEQDERVSQLKKAKEEQLSLVNRISSANYTVAGLERELKNGRKEMEDLKVKTDGLEAKLSKAGEEKKLLEQELKERLNTTTVSQDRISLLSLELKDKEDNVRKLSSSLAEKEAEVNMLITRDLQTKAKLEKALGQIQELEDELVKNIKELDSKNSMVDEMNSTVNTLLVEKDELNKKLNSVEEKYNNLKSFSEKKAVMDARLLEEKNDELYKLKEKLELASNEVSGSQAMITSLTQEREDLRKMLDVEQANVKNLRHELQLTEEALCNSKNDASELGKQLNQSRNKCLELEAEISRVKDEFAEAKETLQQSLEKAIQDGEVLASELQAVRDQLKKTEDEAQNLSNEMTAVTKKRDSLQEELIGVRKKAEATGKELEKEKDVIYSLNNELQSLEKQILKDKEDRESLETDLKEATKSLDEMNRNALLLTETLEMVNSQISSLEDENQMLLKSFTEQKTAVQEAIENMEDARNLVLRLGKEKERLEMKAKKLQEDLAAAKGEILRLRSQINSSKTPVNDQHSQTSETEDKQTVETKRTTRRKTRSPTK